MVNNTSYSDRIINKFPPPFKPNDTPYISTDFAKYTKELCANNKACTSDIKVSKVIILGDVAVGKTSLVNRFCHELFNSNYKATIGVDFEVEQFTILGVPFHLQIWDTAGQERFKCIAQSYYRCAHVVIIVFDISTITTLIHCKTWLKEALAASSKDPFIFLLGTKRDLVSPAAYTQVEMMATKVANLMKAEYWTVSARTGAGIKEMFCRVAALSFDAAMCREKEISIRVPTIGSDIVSLQKNKELDKSHRQKCCIK